MYRYEDDKKKLLQNLKRIEGQVRGIQSMVEDGRYCIDVIIQIQAARAALQQVGFTLMEHHAKGCVAEAIRLGKEDSIDEMLETLKKFTR